MHTISESVLMMLTENYQNWSMLVKTTACLSWRVFWDTVWLLAVKLYQLRIMLIVCLLYPIWLLFFSHSVSRMSQPLHLRLLQTHVLYRYPLSSSKYVLHNSEHSIQTLSPWLDGSHETHLTPTQPPLQLQRLMSIQLSLLAQHLLLTRLDHR